MKRSLGRRAVMLLLDPVPPAEKNATGIYRSLRIWPKWTKEPRAFPRGQFDLHPGIQESFR